MTAPTGQAREILNLAPAAPPRPLLDILADETSEKATNTELEHSFNLGVEGYAESLKAFLPFDLCRMSNKHLIIWDGIISSFQ